MLKRSRSASVQFNTPSSFLLFFFFFFFSFLVNALFCFCASFSCSLFGQHAVSFLFSIPLFSPASPFLFSSMLPFFFSPKPFCFSPKPFCSAHTTVSASFCFVLAFFLFVGSVFQRTFFSVSAFYFFSFSTCLFVQFSATLFFCACLLLNFLPTSKAKKYSL